MIPSIKTITIILIVLVLIVILDTIIKHIKPWVIGRRGEIMVSILLKFLPNNQYKVINDVLINTIWGSSQLDHIVISKYGIFVLETKNYKGSIYGGDYSEKWTQFLQKRKYELINPIKQNATHIKTLQKLLNVDVPYYSIIVFNNKAKVKSNAQTALLVNQKSLLKEIKKYKTEYLSEEDIEKLAEQITSKNINSSKNRAKHINSVKTNIKRVEFCVSNEICPECGAKLTKRKNEYGEFLGCCNYPKCKYTHKYIKATSMN